LLPLHVGASGDDQFVILLTMLNSQLSENRMPSSKPFHPS
jgi:hypothetical protein